jgi:Homeodomain-like domain
VDAVAEHPGRAGAAGPDRADGQHGYSNTEIAGQAGVSRPTVILWRSRYEQGGIGALEDKARSGQPKEIDPLDIVIATLEPPPEKLGVTHWSSRLLAAELGISNATVAQTWQKYELQPWRRQTFKFSTDPELEAKVRDVVGLYLAPPENAVVLCVDEKSQIQALNRTAPVLPLRRLTVSGQTRGPDGSR